MNFNKAIVLGRLTNQPEIRTLPSGQNVATFGLATSRIWYDQQRTKKEETQFHNIVMFGKLADIAHQYLQKGSLLLIEGRIQYRSWEGQDGQKKYRTEIVAESMQLGPKPQGSMSSYTPASPAQKPVASSEPEVPTISEDEVNIQEDIPF